MILKDWIQGRSGAPAPLETRDSGSGYSDALVDLIIAQARGNPLKADIDTSGAVELAAGVVGRAFASAQVESTSGAVAGALTPSTLAHIGRALIRAGESVLVIAPSGGSLALIPASSWDIEGGVRRETWQYRLDIPAPNGTAQMHLPYEGVVHVQYAYAPERAWVGLSPLDVARQAGRMDAEINQALADESGMPRGAILPMPNEPDDGDDDENDTNLKRIEATLGKLAGRIMTVESMMTAAGGGYQEAPKGDWDMKRVGANFPDAMVTLRRDADELILGLCGVPIEFLKSADGSALRETYRRLLFNTIQPLGNIVAQELTEKLEAPVSFSWNELRAADRASGARAYKALREADMPEAQALELSGL